MPPPPTKTPTTPPSKVVKSEPKQEKKPLAGMLPDKYKDTDVRELFPEFRANSVLRFSRLFPIKAAHKPRLWKGFKKRKKRVMEKQQTAGQEKDGGASKDGGKAKKEQQSTEVAVKVEESPPAPFVPRKTNPDEFDFAPFPEDPNMYQEDDSVRFHRPADQKSKEEEEKEERESESKGPKATDWRWGPAQYWYDMLGLPDAVENYDYGLKSALEHMDDENGEVKAETEVENTNNKENEDKALVKTEREATKGNIEFPDDAFLMVTQVCTGS